MISKISHKKKIDVLFLSAYKHSIYMIANKHEQNDTDALLKNFLEMPMLWTREMSSKETSY